MNHTSDQKQKRLNVVSKFLMFFSPFLILIPSFIEAQQLSPKLHNEVEKIRKRADEKVLIDAVLTQNKIAMPLKKIQELDKDWIDGKISKDFIKSLMSSECATSLRKLEKDVHSAMESYVIDAQGALVCSTRMTSDYWQGDEPKWKDAFQSGTADAVIGNRQYDESTKSSLVHVSVPILDQKKTIGVLCVGINLTKLAEQ